MTNIKQKISSVLVIAFFFVGAMNVKAQETVKGTVLDVSTGLPVNAAEILCGEYSSAFTDENGTFSIRIPYSTAILQVKADGFQKQTVAIKGNEALQVKLVSEKVNFTDKYYPAVGSSLEDHLQQQFGEVRTIIRSGAPGVGGNIFIQGYNSLTASSQPLIVVDGIPYETLLTNRPTIISGSFIDPLTNIDPDDIASITIIKDGSAIYGVKGANGVIHITTKRAKEQASRIAISAYWGVNNAPRTTPVLGADDYRTFITEQAVSAGNPNLSVLDYVYLNDDPNQPDYYKYHNRTNWQDEVFRNGLTQNYHGQVTGGDDIGKYSISLGYTDVESTLNNAYLNRFNTRFNTDIDLSKDILMSLGVSYSQTNRQLRDDGAVFQSSPSYLALIKSPLVATHLINSSGVTLQTLADNDFWNVSNPAVIQSDATTGENAQYRLGIYGKLNWTLNTNWLLNATLSYDYDKSSENYFIPDYGTSEKELLRTQEIAFRTAGKVTSRYVGVFGNLSAQYKKTFDYIHQLRATAGVRYQSNSFYYTSGKGSNSAQDRDLYLATSMIGKEVLGNQDDWKWLAAYLDAEYVLKGRYRLSVSVSEDGSSRAGSNQQYALFPSAGLAWNIAAESFLKDVDWLNHLQLRANAGIVGNDNFSYLNAPDYFQSVDYMNVKGIALANLSNKDLKWETTTKTNLGVDIALFNERISLSADVFLNKTKDLITVQPLDIHSGFKTGYVNGGELENRGLEVKLGGRLIDTRDFKWAAQVSAATYKNKVTALPNNASIVNNYLNANILTQVGQPLGVFYGYKSLGVFTTAEAAHGAGLSTYYQDTYRQNFEAGDIHFDNIDGNDLIDENDRQIIGDPNPDFYGTLATSFVYKNVGLDVVFSGVYGNDVYNFMRAQTENMIGYRNQSTSVLSRWKAEGQQTSVPRSDYYDRRGNGRFSDRWIEDGSFLRLKSLTLTWKCPKKLLFLDGFSVFASANNLFVWTNYLGGDPEVSTSGTSIYQGIDAGYLSQGRSFIGGIKINL